jgi:hypothetical protein
MDLKKFALAVRPLLLAFAMLACVLAASPAAQAQGGNITNTATVTANNGFTSTGDGTMSVTTAVVGAPIPTLSSVGLTALSVLLAGFAVYRMRRQASRRA